MDTTDLMAAATHYEVPCLLSDLDLADLRRGSDPNDCYRRLHRRCLEYVIDYRQYRRILSVEDAEEIVSQAVVEELHSIAEPQLGAEEVAVRLKRALNRVRARYARSVGRQISVEVMRSRREDQTSAIQFKEVAFKEAARAMTGCLRRAIENMSDRDRNLLIDYYGFERFGLLKRGDSPVFASSGGYKVALWRARKRFLDEFRRLAEPELALARNSDVLHNMSSLLAPRAECWQDIAVPQGASHSEAAS